MAKHIKDRAEFAAIRYACCWEDSNILCEALQPMAGKKILSIASGGDNSLYLLAHGAEVVAADLNAAQLACCELKIAAIAELDYDDLLAFLGVRSSQNRLARYKQLRARLSPEATAFWDEFPDLIEQGVIHGGKFERYFNLFRRRILPLVHSQKMVLSALNKRSDDERKNFYDKKWDNWRWRILFKVFFSKTVMGHLGRDPEFFRYVEGSVAMRIMERARYAMVDLTTHDNPYLEYILRGNYQNSLPPFLQPEIVKKIKDNIAGITLFQGTIQEAAEQHEPHSFHGFNLSDIFEYLSDDICLSLYSQLLKYAAPKARLAYWNMLVPRCCPDSLKGKITGLPELSEELFKKDRAFFYSKFIIEEVR